MYTTSVLWKPFINTDLCNILSTQKAAAKDPCIRYKSFAAAFLHRFSISIVSSAKSEDYIVHNSVCYVDKQIFAYAVYNPLQYRFLLFFYLSIQLIQFFFVPSFPILSHSSTTARKKFTIFQRIFRVYPQSYPQAVDNSAILLLFTQTAFFKLLIKPRYQRMQRFFQ